MIPTECRFVKPSDKDALLRFHDRLKKADIDAKLVRLAIDPQLPGEVPGKDTYICRKSVAAFDGDEIHATQLYFLNQIFIKGKPYDFVYPAGPISETLINKKYAFYSVTLLRYTLSLQPFHMAIGCGSYQEQISKIFLALGWKHQKVAFYFLPIKIDKILRELSLFKKNKYLKLISKVLVYSNLPRFGECLCSLIQRTPVIDYTYTIESTFENWADEIWYKSLPEYQALVKRDSDTLNLLYKPYDDRYFRIKVQKKRKNIGWLIVTIKNMQDDKYFGNLKVGAVVDGLCPVKEVEKLMEIGVKFLRENNVDVCVANWSHYSWQKASKKLGFMQGPSNYIFFVSQAGSSKLLTDACPLTEIHLSRGDGDGPLTLVPDELARTRPKTGL